MVDELFEDEKEVEQIETEAKAKRDALEKKKKEKKEVLVEKPKKEEKAIVKKPSSDIAPLKRAPGTEEVSTEDWRPARLRLLQSTSAEVQAGTSPAGKIKDDLTGEELDKIELIPLLMKKSRVLFDPDDRQGPPICRSSDLKIGSGCECGCKGVCANCKKLEGFPPECSLVYNYLAVSPSDLSGAFVVPSVF